MNRTQTLTAQWLRSLDADETLLLEALLRRGFLALRDGADVFLGSGSHENDLRALRLVEGISVDSTGLASGRVARVRFASMRPAARIEAALRIVRLAEHHVGGSGGFTGVGVGGCVTSSWTTYCRMRWGAKLPVCPADHSDQNPVENALDLGIALLVKSLPLARVATSASCDGHGVRPARISFHFPWDVPWACAVFDVLDEPHPGSRWLWSPHDGTSSSDALVICPTGGYDDSGVLRMLHDIQAATRRLLDAGVIDAIGKARAATLASFSKGVPTLTEFAIVAGKQLATHTAAARRV